MLAALGVVLSAVFGGLAGLHGYWALGGRWGSQAVFPTKDDDQSAPMPGAGPTLVVAASLLGMGVLVLSKARLVALPPAPDWLDRYALWAIAALFALRAIGEFRYVGFFKQIKHTRFGQNDTAYYSPLCLVVSMMALALAWFAR